MTPQSYSLHIGLNAVNPDSYEGWDGQLFACENDAKVYKSIAENADYKAIHTLLTKEATSENVLKHLDDAAKKLQSGDILFLTYSGHGGSIIDVNNDDEDGFDETWCLYDRQLIDDELFESFSKFNPGVRILIFSDSCHSGSVSKNVAPIKPDTPVDPKTYMRSRLAPMNVLIRTYNKHKDQYDEIQEKATKRAEDIGAYVILFGACQDNEEAMEVWGNGMFTAKVKKVMAGEIKSYSDLFSAIKKGFSIEQHPNLFHYGNKDYNFLSQSPFCINGKKAVINTPEAPSVKEDEDELIISKQSKQRARAKGAVQSNKYELQSVDKASGKAWDKAYEAYLADPDVRFAEPNIKSPYLKPTAARAQEEHTNEYMKNWPPPEASPNEFIWHLDDEHSQLRKAYDAVIAKHGAGATVRIGHIDTGYIPGHPSTPTHLLTDLGVSFVKNEFGENKGIDKLNSGFPAEQDGHGCATLALLAGKEISDTDSYAGYKGLFGAVPFAEVIPIRICETVFNLFNANDVADGIDYAVNYGCEVITMSMAGYPTKRVAEAVNRAYENGVIVVTAAGNNFKSGIAKLTPKAVLYPARFERVIAATGACYNHEPYDLDVNPWFRSRSAGGELMQGNWGPSSAMQKAIAAYTPNVAWASQDEEFRFLRSGGGTSSATPQVAATAALWIAYNRDNLQSIKGTWKVVEAARSAIFNTANKTYPSYRKYYGNGIIRAFDALTAFDFDKVTELQPSAKAKVGFTGLGDFFSGWFRSRAADDNKDVHDYEGLKEMVSLELLQLMHKDPNLMPYAEELDLEKDETSAYFAAAGTKKAFAEKVLESEYASDFIKDLMKGILG
ncbi:Serine protease, subtilisin family [Chitinophaga sp. CF118]|uniref:S8 family serine peptidase n=1 Tax=Chitinophaga sp. CF118 TaxID=1884367 RepID=UPI0008E7B5E8|nr:S8 family serine peptidase [Chitinophaga sp. CF118]SFF02680.1 Serine protease, subtilisin family [Chitinophaga sp. CF118]